jgi:hypothetical protein
MVNVENCFHNFLKWYNKIVLSVIQFADRGLGNSDLKKQLLAITEADDDVTRVGNLVVLYLNQILFFMMFNYVNVKVDRSLKK